MIALCFFVSGVVALTISTGSLDAQPPLALPAEATKVAPRLTTCPHTLSEWRTAAPAPAGHLEGASAVIDGRLYLFGGYESYPLVSSTRVDVYNPATNIWETEAAPRGPMPFATSHMQAALDGTDVWFAGGFVGNHPGPLTNEVWRYDSVNDQWWQGPSLPVKRASGAMAVYNGRLHYISGLRDRQNDVPTHYVLDLRNPTIWTTLAPLPRPRNHFQAVVIGGKIYVVGGQVGHDDNPVDVAQVDVYDPATGTWAVRAKMPAPRSHFEPATLKMGARIVGLGGRANTLGQSAVGSVVQYHPPTNRWHTLGDLPVPLYESSAGFINDQLIVTAGGTNWNVFQSNTWIADAVLPLRCPEAYAVNSGFEIVAQSDGELAFGWTLAAGEAARVCGEGARAHKGRCALRINAARQTRVVQEIDASDLAINAESLRLAVSATASGLGARARARAVITYDDGSRLNMPIPLPGGTYARNQRSVSFMVNKPVARIVIEITTTGNGGTLWVDDVVLRRVNTDRAGLRRVQP